MKQPMAGVAALFALGIGLGNRVPASPVWLSLAALLSCLAAVVSTRHPRPWLALGLVMAGWANVAREAFVLSPFDVRETTPTFERLTTLRGILVASPEERVSESFGRPTRRTLAYLDVQERVGHDGRAVPARGRVIVVTPGPVAPHLFGGLDVAITGVMRLPPGPQAPGLFDYRGYLADRGVHRELRASSVDDWKVLTAAEHSRPPWADRFQAWARRTLARGAPEEDEALRLLWAMTLGWKTALVDEVEEPFQRSGTMHVFAISGLHVALIANVLVQALRLVFVPRRLAGAVALPTIWAYIAATGWQSSAVRSAVMSTVVIVSWMTPRPVDLLNSLAVAAFAVLVWEPTQLFQAGFQLSFAVVAAIGLLVPRFQERLAGWTETDPFLPPESVPAWRRVLTKSVSHLGMHLAVSIAAWLGSIPLTAWHFHLVTPSGLVANLLVVPLSACALASSIASLACGDLLPTVGECFNHGAWFWMVAMLGISRHIAAWPYASWHAETPPVSLVILGYLGLFALGTRAWSRPKGRRPLGIALVTLTAASVGEWTSGRWETRIGILALRGGQSVCVQDADGTFLIDCGDAAAARHVVHPYLWASGIDRLDALWLSHGDIRHVGGALEIVDRYAPEAVFGSAIPFRSSAYRGLTKQLASRTSPPIRTVGAGDLTGRCRVLHPADGDRFPQADDGSLVLRYGSEADGVLMLGDLGRPGQERLLTRHPTLRADLVVSGIPVRGEPLEDALLNQLAPRAILVVDAQYPATARASTPCKVRLRKRGTPIWFTSETGSVELRRRRGTWEILDAEGSRLVRLEAREEVQLRTNPGSFPVTR